MSAFNNGKTYVLGPCGSCYAPRRRMIRACHPRPGWPRFDYQFPPEGYSPAEYLQCITWLRDAQTGLYSFGWCARDPLTGVLTGDGWANPETAPYQNGGGTGGWEITGNGTRAELWDENSGAYAVRHLLTGPFDGYESILDGLLGWAAETLGDWDGVANEFYIARWAWPITGGIYKVLLPVYDPTDSGFFLIGRELLGGQHGDMSEISADQSWCWCACNKDAAEFKGPEMYSKFFFSAIDNTQFYWEFPWSAGYLLRQYSNIYHLVNCADVSGNCYQSHRFSVDPPTRAQLDEQATYNGWVVVGTRTDCSG